MKNKIYNALWTLGMFIGIAYISFIVGNRRGIAVGYEAALDTINSICRTQLESDTTVTKLIMAHPDTHTYFLSRETPLD